MKARHKHLMDQVQQFESSVQSKLSSYNASLDLIDKDIKFFLARPPISQPSSATTLLSTNGASSPETFYSLHPKRRTLSLASEQWRAEREALAQMQKLSHDSITQHERDEGMMDVLSSMDKTMQLLERRLQEADEKDWKLSLCCMGAEFEAFREGREMLLEASGLGDIAETEPNELLDLRQEHAAVPSPPDSPDEAFYISLTTPRSIYHTAPWTTSGQTQRAQSYPTQTMRRRHADPYEQRYPT